MDHRAFDGDAHDAGGRWAQWRLGGVNLSILARAREARLAIPLRAARAARKLSAAQN
jgi:hypothetical protein